MTVLPYLLVRARVHRLLAHTNYIEAFHYSMSDGDQIEVFKTNLKIAMERLKQFKIPGSLEAEESKLEAMGDDFEMILSLDKSPSENKQELQSTQTDSDTQSSTFQLAT